ncbi:RNA 2',3'-cyclic phosphodiesterase [Patulibacter brassicae]|uniref:RNA 2',3'-cyclic phosphodiesterase n=1 Tax=Patulibacter brassicae TaxID=1705717 RepID=A0ABU4VJV6_9ACTN|nr:RNA 2',3'-cyclic phosphodiesterase [Patulibacter brassicae]MDX8152127.1 RNA 2',3'-cyclic phosphodiesterase [Patulibacter brassicae]
MPRSGPVGVRLFVALELPAAVRRGLGGWVRGQRALRTTVRPVPEEQLHLTLAFLGERPAAEIEPLAGAVALAGTDRSCLDLETGAPIWLPPRRPRALAIEVHDLRGDLAELHRSLTDALADAVGWRPDRRLRPHVTVGRRRPEAGPDPGAAPDPTPDLRFDAPALALVRSTLRPSGAEHQVLERVPLA